MTNQKRQATALVLEIMNQKDLSRMEVVRRMDYANTNKGLRRLDRFLLGEETDSELVPKLIEDLGLKASSMNEAIEKDQLRDHQFAEDYARKIFKPYVYIQTYATRPSSICPFAMTDGTRTHKMIDVPDEILAKQWHEQSKDVGSLVRKHYQAVDGVALFFGKISGYLYCPSYDSSYEFTVQGETDEVDKGHFWLPEASVRIK